MIYKETTGTYIKRRDFIKNSADELRTKSVQLLPLCHLRFQISLPIQVMHPLPRAGNANKAKSNDSGIKL